VFASLLDAATKKLMDTLARDCSTSTKQPLLIVCFDEKRHLCNTSAITDPTIKKPAKAGQIGEIVEVQVDSMATKILGLLNAIDSITWKTLIRKLLLELEIFFHYCMLGIVIQRAR
jgi:hypothetical protein